VVSVIFATVILGAIRCFSVKQLGAVVHVLQGRGGSLHSIPKLGLSNSLIQVFFFYKISDFNIIDTFIPFNFVLLCGLHSSLSPWDPHLYLYHILQEMVPVYCVCF